MRLSHHLQQPVILGMHGYLKTMEFFRNLKTLYEELRESFVLFALAYLAIMFVSYTAQQRHDLASSVLILAFVTLVLEGPKIISRRKDRGEYRLLKAQTMDMVNLEASQVIIALNVLDDYYIKKSERGYLNDRELKKDMEG